MTDERLESGASEIGVYKESGHPDLRHCHGEVRGSECASDASLWATNRQPTTTVIKVARNKVGSDRADGLRLRLPATVKRHQILRKRVAARSGCIAGRWR
jgi:hypothetical protein